MSNTGWFRLKDLMTNLRRSIQKVLTAHVPLSNYTNVLHSNITYPLYIRVLLRFNNLLNMRWDTFDTSLNNLLF